MCITRNGDETIRITRGTKINITFFYRFFSESTNPLREISHPLFLSSWPGLRSPSPGRLSRDTRTTSGPEKLSGKTPGKKGV
jgi:hypothetical protein